jgi:hypothetical protein
MIGGLIKYLKESGMKGAKYNSRLNSSTTGKRRTLKWNLEL